MTRLSTIIVAALPVLCASSTLKPPPNVRYTGFGYNLLEGNPRPTQTGVDDGWQRAVFDMTYEDGDTAFLLNNTEYKQPDNVTLTGTRSCVQQFKSRTHTTAKSYTESLSVSASADFSGWGASFKASADYKEVEEGTFYGGYIYVETDFKCEIYDTRVELFTPLHPDFIFSVGALSVDYDEDELFDFIDLFGTHYAERTSMGGVYGRRYKFTHEAYETLKEESVSVDVKAEYRSMAVSGSASALTETESRQAEAVANAETSSTEYWYGGDTDTALTSTHDLNAWTSTISSDPLPVSWSLEPISDLLVARNFPNDASIVNKQANLETALLNYCTRLQAQGKIDCNELVQGDRTLQTSAQCFEPLANEVYDDVVSLDSNYDFYFSYEYAPFDECMAKCCEGINCGDAVQNAGCTNRCNQIPIDEAADYHLLAGVDVAAYTAEHVDSGAHITHGITREECVALCDGLFLCDIAIFGPSTGSCFPLSNYGDFVERGDREVLYTRDQCSVSNFSAVGVKTDSPDQCSLDGCTWYLETHHKSCTDFCSDNGLECAAARHVGRIVGPEIHNNFTDCAGVQEAGTSSVWCGYAGGARFAHVCKCRAPPQTTNTPTPVLREVFRFGADRTTPDTGVDSRNLAVFTYTDPANGVNELHVYAGEQGDRYCPAPMYYGVQDVHITANGRTYTVYINGALGCSFTLQDSGKNIASTQMITTNHHPAAKGLVCNALLFNKNTHPLWYPFSGAKVNIYARHSRKTMALRDNVRSNGQSIVQNEWIENDSAQAWKLDKSTNSQYLDAYMIRLSDATGYCVTMGGQISHGFPLELKTCNGGTNQLWRFVETHGYHNIQSVSNSDRWIDVSGHSHANEAKIHAWPKTGGANQEWFFRELL